LKKVLFGFMVLALAAFFVGMTANDASAAKPTCVTIQSGLLKYQPGHYLGGQPLTMGYDPYGYNYQAHMFSGSYVNVYLGGDGFPPYNGDDTSYLAQNPTVAGHWAWPYRSVTVLMKWNDAWISNMDCDKDGKLDRHFGYPSYRDSGAWETNHMQDEYTQDGKKCNWIDFVKIVAVPSDAKNIADIWYSSDGTEIGPNIWDEFATIQEIFNDPCAGYHGPLYVSPSGPGFGKWK